MDSIIFLRHGQAENNTKRMLSGRSPRSATHSKGLSLHSANNNNIRCTNYMKVGIIGGTGGMGKGFAIRWCKENDVLIGSRDATRAVESATKYEQNAKEAYGTINGSVSGYSNEEVVMQYAPNFSQKQKKNAL